MGIKIQACDMWFSKALRQSRGNQCENCGTMDAKMECCHIYGRRNSSTRWDTDNCLCMCHSCHRHYTENPVLFHNWLANYLGSGKMAIIQEKHTAIFKVNPKIKADIAKHYREEYRTIVDNPDHALVSYQ